MRKRQAQVLSRRLDKIANHVESRYVEMGLTKKQAYDFCLYLDETSDLLERAAEEDDDLLEDEEVDAATLKREMDEPYMDHFDNPHQPHQIHQDEPYMRHFEEDPSTQLVDDADLTPENDGEWGVSASNWYDRSARRSARGNWYTRKSTRKSNWYE